MTSTELSKMLRRDLLADNLADLYAYRVESSPDSVLARFEDRVLTYGQMDYLVQSIRSTLQNRGAKVGDVVATFMPNSVTHLALLLACASEGMVWGPVNVSLARSDLSYTLSDLSPKILFVSRSLEEKLREAEVNLPCVVVVEEETAEMSGLEDWLSVGSPLGRPTVKPETSLAIIYSGGTTGLPKGIIVSHFAALSGGLRMNEILRFDEKERFFSTLQFYHAWTPLTVLPFCMYFEHEFCFWPWWSASRFRDYVRRYEATVVDPYIGMVATLLHTEPCPDDASLPMRVAIAGLGGADPNAVAIRRRYEEQFGIVTYQMYSLTETGALACVEMEGEERRFGSSGKPRGWYEIAVSDDEGFPVAQGVVGEILVRPNFPNLLAKGYHNRWSETVQTWRDLWVHTGDLGYFDEDGYLYFVGRKGHFLRRRGELISVFEVEATLAEHPGVVEAAVVGVPSELGEDDVLACIVRQSEEVTPEQLAAYCLERVAYFKVPRFFRFVERLPRSSAKQEIERFKLVKEGTAGAWDRQSVRSDL